MYIKIILKKTLSTGYMYLNVSITLRIKISEKRSITHRFDVAIIK